MSEQAYIKESVEQTAEGICILFTVNFLYSNLINTHYQKFFLFWRNYV